MEPRSKGKKDIQQLKKKNLHAFANVCLSLSYMEMRFELFKLWFAWGHVKFVRVIIKNLEEIKGQKFK